MFRLIGNGLDICQEWHTFEDLLINTAGLKRHSAPDLSQSEKDRQVAGSMCGIKP